MQILSSVQIEQQLGRFGLFSGKAGNSIVGQVTYLGGVPAFDAKRGPAGISPVSFEMRPNGVEVFIFDGFSRASIALFSDKINYWAFEPQKEIVERKSKSIIGRALVGGLLLGPIGAIVGGMTGIGDKEKVKSVAGIDNVLTLSYADADGERIMLFDCGNKNTKTVLAFFHKNFPALFVDGSKEVQVSAPVSVADELIKLKGLLDAGAITQEEFEKQKRTLLQA